MSMKRCQQAALFGLVGLFSLFFFTFALYPQQAQAGPHTKQGSGESAIAYVAPSYDNQQIRLIKPDGSNDRLLWQAPADTARVDGIGELSWRSDASALAFDSGHDWQHSMSIRDIYAIAPDGSRFRRITDPPSPADAQAYPSGTVTFMLHSFASGDVQVYIEGAHEPISFFAKLGYTYQITQTLPDLGQSVRQNIRIWDPSSFQPPCFYSEEGWVDVNPGQLTDAGRIGFGVVGYTCSKVMRPAWLWNGNDLLYLFAEASTVYQDENNIWRIAENAPPTDMGTRVLDYGQYVGEGRLVLALPGRSASTANQLLAMTYESGIGSNIFIAPIDKAGQRQFINFPLCGTICLVAGIAWLPDGSGFVFSRYEEQLNGSNFEHSSAIYRYTFANQQLTELYRVANAVIDRLDVAPDGSQIVFERSNAFDDSVDSLWQQPLLLCPCQVWLVNSDGTNDHLLVNDGRAPVWSPAPLPATLPTLTPTPTRPGIPAATPTPTPTTSPVLTAQSTTTGAPGSRFVFQGNNFPASQALPVGLFKASGMAAIPAHSLASPVHSDANGQVAFTLVTTTTLTAGQYNLTVGTAATAFTLDAQAPLQQPTPVGEVVALAPTDLAQKLFLPIVKH